MWSYLNSWERKQEPKPPLIQENPLLTLHFIQVPTKENSETQVKHSVMHAKRRPFILVVPQEETMYLLQGNGSFD